MRAIYAALSSEYAIILFSGLASARSWASLHKTRLVNLIYVNFASHCKGTAFFSLSDYSQQQVISRALGCLKFRKEDASIGLCSNARLRHLPCASDEGEGKARIKTNQQGALQCIK